MLYSRAQYQPLLRTIEFLSSPPGPDATAAAWCHGGGELPGLPDGRATLTLLGCPDRDGFLGPGHGGRYFGAVAAAELDDEAFRKRRSSLELMKPSRPFRFRTIESHEVELAVSDGMSNATFLIELQLATGGGGRGVARGQCPRGG